MNAMNCHVISKPFKKNKHSKTNRLLIRKPKGLIFMAFLELNFNKTIPDKN